MNTPASPVQAEAWYRLSAQDTLARWSVSADAGLSPEEAAKRREQYGPNRLQEGKKISAIALLLAQLKNVLIIILLLSTGLSAVLGHEVEAISIGIIVLFAVLLGFAQEFRAEKAIDALRKMAAPTATVLRGGAQTEIAAEDIVPGDIVLLAAGDKIPADGRLLEAVSLQAEEASLTGESLPVEKTAAVIDKADMPLGDRRNMVFASTAASYGRGKLVVTETGMRTEVGKIAGLLQSVETNETPLQKNLDKLGHTLAKAAFVIVFIVCAIGYFRGQPLLEMFIFGIALAVAVVPEALPAVVTISLALGVQRMVKRHALVRRLPAVETLGSTTVICSDKTGTLTKDEMTARRIYTSSVTLEITGSGYAPEGGFTQGGKDAQPDAVVLELLKGGALASDARMVQDNGQWDVQGDPTEGGLLVAAEKAGLEKDRLDKESPRTGEIPFSSETKRMTTLHGSTAYAKGAFEVILASCTRILTAEGEKELTQQDKDAVLKAADLMAADALRVLGVARKEVADIKDAEKGMTFLGLVGMIDPPRPEAKDAVAKCKGAGIKVIMITGDHPATAKAIAKDLKILDGGRVVTGPELEAMSDAQLEKEVGGIDVYARVSPLHKLRVVTALQKNGHVVAMTGDGVNDAPALKKADIGVAMGITGTDVAKEAAAMNLTDDNFASIVASVEEGRAIFGNIKKYLMYLLSSNIGEICIMTGAAVLGLPLPLSAVQILYVNLATDGLPALALAVDPPEKDLMTRPPRDPKISIFTRPVLALMLIGGFWSTIVNLCVFYWALKTGRATDDAMTLAFATLICIEFFKAYAFRSDRRSVIEGMLSNKWLNLSILSGIACMLLIIYLPLLQTPFGTYPLAAFEWGIVIVAAATVIPVLEIGKLLVRRGVFGKPA